MPDSEPDETPSFTLSDDQTMEEVEPLTEEDKWRSLLKFWEQQGWLDERLAEVDFPDGIDPEALLAGNAETAEKVEGSAEADDLHSSKERFSKDRSRIEYLAIPVVPCKTLIRPNPLI